MTQEVINIGTTSNDGTGDTIRVSFRKTNNNFSNLFSSAGNATANLVSLNTKVETYNGNMLLLGSAAFTAANNGYNLANTANTVSVAASTRSNNAANTANGAAVNASAAYAYANSLVNLSANAHTKANASYVVANAAFTKANTVDTTNQTVSDLTVLVTQHVFVKANDAYDLSLQVYSHGLGVEANTTASFNRANSIYGYLNTSSAKVNSLFTVANSGYVVTNSAYTTTNNAYFTTNSAYRHANAAFDTANSKINTANGTATGSFIIQDSVTINTYHSVVGSGATFRTGNGNYGVRIYPGGGTDANASILRLTNSAYATLGIFTANNTEVTIGSNTAIPVIVKYNGSQMGRFDGTGLYVSGEVAGFYSDERLKTNIKPITGALTKVNRLKGVTYNGNEIAAKFGFSDTTEQVGLLAQDLQGVLPQVVKPAPFDTATDENGKQYSLSGENYKTVQYDKIVPLLVEAIKELSAKVKKLEGKK